VGSCDIGAIFAPLDIAMLALISVRRALPSAQRSVFSLSGDTTSLVRFLEC